MLWDFDIASIKRSTFSMANCTRIIGDRTPAQIQDLIADLQIFKNDPSDASLTAVRKKLITLIADIDEKLSEQINHIQHHEDFQQLESAWRGLHYLISHTESDEMLKVKVMSITSKELQKTMKLYKYAPCRNPLFIQLSQKPYTNQHGEPFGCLIGDYHFGTDAISIETLSALAMICSLSHCPFISGGAASIVGFETWHDLAELAPGQLNEHFNKIIFSAKSADQLPLSQRAWYYLRESQNTRYIYLAAPRFLVRYPHATSSLPSERFTFKEQNSKSHDSLYIWINAAYFMGVIINRAFSHYGWCHCIQGYHDATNNGSPDNLPSVTVPQVGYNLVFQNERAESSTKCCTEIAIHADSGVAERLAIAGLLPFVAHPLNESHTYTSQSTIYLMNSLHKPSEFDDPCKTAHNILSSRLNYLLPVWRFVHYLRCIVRDHLAIYQDLEHMQQHLQDWLQRYIHDNPKAALQMQQESLLGISNNCNEEINANLTTIAQKPLAEAKIRIEPEYNTDIYCTAVLYLQPLYQVAGLDRPIRMRLQFPVPDKLRSATRPRKQPDQGQCTESSHHGYQGRT